MQHAPDRNGQRASHALRVILLQTRNCVAHFIGEDAVNRSAVVSQPRQIPLQRADVSRLRDQLASGFEIIQRPPSMSPCKVGFVQSRATLMQKSPFISRCQRIRGVKERPIKKYFIDVSSSDNSAERDDEQSCDGILHNLFALYWCSTKRQVR